MNKYHIKMNWKNVYSIDWRGIDEEGKYIVNYKGSRHLPPPYVSSDGCTRLTESEFRMMYLILRREAKEGVPIQWAGDEVIQTIPRVIEGLEKIELYFKEEKEKREIKREIMKMKRDLENLNKQNEELKESVKRLEEFIYEFCNETIVMQMKNLNI